MSDRHFLRYSSYRFSFSRICAKFFSAVFIVRLYLSIVRASLCEVSELLVEPEEEIFIFSSVLTSAKMNRIIYY